MLSTPTRQQHTCCITAPLAAVDPLQSAQGATSSSLPPPASLHVCRYCTLGPDSLDPLGQLVSLRELDLSNCTGVTAASVERLLSTSVQGCSLEISFWDCGDEATTEDCIDLYNSVVAQRGSRDTPELSVCA
jgi:hypothetical protein